MKTSDLIKKHISEMDSKDPILFYIVKKPHRENSEDFHLRFYSDDFRCQCEDDFVTGSEYMCQQIAYLTEKYAKRGIQVVFEFSEQMKPDYIIPDRQFAPIYDYEIMEARTV